MLPERYFNLLSVLSWRIPVFGSWLCVLSISSLIAASPWMFWVQVGSHWIPLQLGDRTMCLLHSPTILTGLSLQYIVLFDLEPCLFVRSRRPYSRWRPMLVFARHVRLTVLFSSLVLPVIQFLTVYGWHTTNLSVCPCWGMASREDFFELPRHQHHPLRS